MDDRPQSHEKVLQYWFSTNDLKNPTANYELWFGGAPETGSVRVSFASALKIF
jgi:hypothetical protein